MGLEIVSAEFNAADFERFKARLQVSLGRLREVLAAPGFGSGPATIGAELELVLVNRRWNAAFENLELLDALGDSTFTPEVNRYNIELNCPPLAFDQGALAALHQQFAQALLKVRGVAAGRGLGVMAIGTLPTLTDADLGLSALTPLARYRALDYRLIHSRQRSIRLRIEGEDTLNRRVEHVTYEGANTSMQIHLRVAPDRFARIYNAAQLASGPALALAGNSPLFLQRRLWEETRIVVFKQSADDRCSQHLRDRAPPRVDFGTEWLDDGIYELFERNVRIHEPLLPVEDDEDLAAANPAPQLAALRLHQGTVWTWNRGIYDPADGGHLRIEFRALPAGPTVTDMVANAAFLLGLTLGLAGRDRDPKDAIPFKAARNNFYRAAQHGLRAPLVWPAAPGRTITRDAAELAVELVPLAREGLLAYGVDAREVDRYLGIIEQRVASGQTGARWQRAWLERHGGQPDLNTLRDLTAAYQARSLTDQPVHTWSCR